MPPKHNLPQHAGKHNTTASQHVPDHSILHHPAGSKTNRKGVEFDPTLSSHNYEDTTRKGHTKPEDYHKLEEEIDLNGMHGKRIFADNLYNSLHPLCTLLKVIGRFPLSRNPDKENNQMFTYSAKCASMSMFYFNIITIILYYALLTGLYTIVNLMLDVPINHSKYTGPRKIQADYDRTLIKRHSIPVVIVFTTLVQACIASAFFTRKHYYLAHIFTYLERACYILHMDLADKTKNFSIQSAVKFTIVTCVFIICTCLKFGPSTIGSSTVFGSLMVHIFLGFGNNVWLDLENKNKILFIQILGGVFLAVIFTASIAPTLLFIYQCKVVKNAFAFWNGRAYCALLRGKEYAQTEETRTTYNLLFKDHCVLLDLVECIDKMYSLTLETFFALQVVSLFFQMYLFYRTGKESMLFASIDATNRYNFAHIQLMRPYDWLPALAIVITTSVILFSAGKAAADVAEEAAAGKEIIRRKGIIGRRTDQELEFMYSMNYSFQAYKKIEVSGAGYLYYRKAFILQVFAVALFCFLLLCQYHPVLDYRPKSRSSPFEKSMSRFLRLVEGSRENLPDDWIWH